MGKLNEHEYLIRMKEIQLKNLNKERKRKLKEEKKKCKHKKQNKKEHKKKFKLPSASKLILLGAILLCLEIVLFCEYVMLKLGDTSAMYVLIGIPATLIPVIWGYYSKAKAENTVGGIKHDTAMAELNQNVSYTENPVNMNPEHVDANG